MDRAIKPWDLSPMRKKTGPQFAQLELTVVFTIDQLAKIGAGCLVPRFDGAIHSLEWKEALWGRRVMAALRPRKPLEQQYSAVLSA